MSFRHNTFAAALFCALTATAAQAAGPIQSITKLWTFGNTNGQAAAAADRFSSEIGAWDPLSQSLFVVGGRGIEVLALDGTRLQTFDAIAAGLGVVNSIAIANGVAAVSFSNSTPQNPGSVHFFSTSTFASSGGAAASLGSVTVGAVPDMVTWTANGTKLLIANEGERQSNAVNPSGSISVIGYNAAAPGSSTVSTIGFTAFDGQEAALRASGVRIQSGVAASIAFEPEYIAVSADGSKAFVTMQENNAVAIVDLNTNSVSSIKSLGLKDFSLPGNGIDPADRDGKIELRNVPVKGLYMADAIASYSAGGKSFYVLANEGDAFVDDSDIVRFSNSGVSLDPTVFNGIDLPTQAQLKTDANLNRLNIVRTGATGDGGIVAMQEIITLGGRSFSIRDENGNLVWDSGNSLEQAAIDAGIYIDTRSDDKGVEPEGVTLFTLGSRTIAAIGLERTSESAIALYDITDPTAVSFLQLLRSGSTAEFRVEGITVFQSGGKTYLAMLNEDTGNPLSDGAPANNTVLFEITPVPEPGTWALMAGGLGLLVARARRSRAVKR